MKIFKGYNSLRTRGALLITASAVFFSAIAVMSGGGETDAAPAVQNAEEPRIGYVLRLTDGSLTVSENGSRISLLEYEIEPNTLSSYDKALLTDGISVRNTDELKRLIEDYTS